MTHYYQNEFQSHLYIYIYIYIREGQSNNIILVIISVTCARKKSMLKPVSDARRIR
jgi:hypothetical protein